MLKKGVVVYASKYGATERYAKWLAQETGFDCMKAKSADIKEISGYDVIIFGGGIYASGIAGISFLKKNYAAVRDKAVAVFCVGASPYDEAALKQIVDHNFKGAFQGIRCFYCRGAWDEERMTFTDRTLCRMLQRVLSKKDPSSYEIWEKALMSAVGQKQDWTDRKYLAPILRWIDG